MALAHFFVFEARNLFGCAGGTENKLREFLIFPDKITYLDRFHRQLKADVEWLRSQIHVSRARLIADFQGGGDSVPFSQSPSILPF